MFASGLGDDFFPASLCADTACFFISAVLAALVGTANARGATASFAPNGLATACPTIAIIAAVASIEQHSRAWLPGIPRIRETTHQTMTKKRKGRVIFRKGRSRVD